MMLRNKSPVNSTASSNSKTSSNFLANVTPGGGGSDDDKLYRTGGGPPESSAAAAAGGICSPTRKLTHRRGYSHGSLNPTSNIVTTTSAINAGNTSFHYVNTLGRTSVNSSEMQLSEKRNQQSALISKNFLHQPNNNNNSEQQQQPSMMKANSNDYIQTDGFDSSNHHISITNPQSTPNEDTKRAISQIEQKIRKTKEALKMEQVRCNENVNEYLRLTSNAQSSQGQRIKSVFEKNNFKSTQRISRYQKKLKRYEETLKNIKESGIYYRHTRERLRDVGTNIKEGISGLSGGVIEGIRSGIHTAGETVISKPKEFFKRNAADTSAEKTSSEQEQSSGLGGIQSSDSEVHHHHGVNSALLNSNSQSHSHSTKCTSEEDSSSITSGSGQLGTNSQNNSAHHSSSPLRVKQIKKSPGQSYSGIELEQIRLKLEEQSQDCLRFSEEIDSLKSQLQTECCSLSQALHDDKYRIERVEEQLNDLTELHQKEIENLKQTISDLEEKIQYQTEERHRDVHEMLESFQTRISRMEHQQHQHLQQLVNLDSLENTNARALVLKLINVLLTILQVILLLVATIANILSPFLHTRMRIYTSAIVIIIFTFVFQHWPDLSVWIKQKIYENCVYVLSLIPFLPFYDSGG